MPYRLFFATIFLVSCSPKDVDKLGNPKPVRTEPDRNLARNNADSLDFDGWNQEADYSPDFFWQSAGFPFIYLRYQSVDADPNSRVLVINPPANPNVNGGLVTTIHLDELIARRVSLDTTTVAYSSIDLNMNYPNAGIDHKIICPGITGGGKAYTKIVEDGGSDVWTASDIEIIN